MADVNGGIVEWILRINNSDFDNALDAARKSINNTATEGEKKFSDFTTKVSKSLKNLGSDIENTGRALITLGAAPTVALIGVAKAAIDFESSFAGIRKTVDLSEEGFQKLSTNLRDLSRRAPVDVNDLNHIAELAGQLGVSGVDNLTKFTETITKFTTATGIAGETAASSFARIANIMGEPIENIDRMGSVVAQLGDSSAATEGEILEFSERIAGAGKIAGLSTANIFSIGAAMASVGVEAEAGGTAVQKVLLSMYQAASGSTSAVIDNSKAINKNTGDLKELQGKLQIAEMRQKEFTDKTRGSTKALADQNIGKYKDQIAALTNEQKGLVATNGQAALSASSFAKVIGVTNKEFEKLFKANPEKVFSMFVTKLGEMSKNGGDAAKVLEDLELGDQRLLRSFLSLSNAGGLLNDQIAIGNQEWKDNTRLTDEASKRYATTASQIKIAQNNLYDIGITIGSVVLPALNGVLTRLKPMIDGFAQFANQNPQLVAGLLAAGAAVGALGIGLVALGAVVSSIGTLISAAGAAITLMLSPVGLAVIGVGLLAAGVYYLNTQTNIFKNSQDLLTQSTDQLRLAQNALTTAQDTLTASRARVEGSTLAVERAQKVYNDTVKKYGPNALESREAAFQLTEAQRANEQAVKDTDAALKNLETQQTVVAEKQKEHQQIIENTANGFYKVRDAIISAANALGSWLSKISRVAPQIGLPGFARGVSNFKGGMALVGERGPELINLPSNSDVIPNGRSMQMLDNASSEGGRTQNISVNIANMNVRDQSDIESISRELGFRLQTSPGFING